MVSFDLATAPNWKQHSNLPWFSSKWSKTFLPKLPLRYNTKLTCSLSLLRAVHAVMVVPFLVSMSARSVRRRAVSSEIITSITKNITVYTRWTCRWKNRIMQYNWLPVTRIRFRFGHRDMTSGKTQLGFFGRRWLTCYIDNQINKLRLARLLTLSC